MLRLFIENDFESKGGKKEKEQKRQTEKEKV